MDIFCLTTQLDNQIDHGIEFDVVGGFCPLPDLPPGRILSVKLSLILRCCRKYGSPDWPIRVLINNEFIGVYIHPRDHLLFLTRIVFRYEPDGKGSYDLCVLGKREKGVDYVLRLRGIGRIFGKNTKWDKRPWVRIGQADSEWKRNSRNQSNMNIAPPSSRIINRNSMTTSPPSSRIRNQNSMTTSSPPSRIRNQSSTIASPPRQERRSRRRSTRSTHDDFVTNARESSTMIKEMDHKTVHGAIALKEMDSYVRVCLLVLAFTLVVFAYSM